jgi:hypothetical protein
MLFETTRKVLLWDKRLVGVFSVLGSNEQNCCLAVGRHKPYILACACALHVCAVYTSPQSVNDVLCVCLRLAAATHSGCVAQSRDVCGDVAYAVTKTHTRQLAG